MRDIETKVAGFARDQFAKRAKVQRQRPLAEREIDESRISATAIVNDSFGIVSFLVQKIAWTDGKGSRDKINAYERAFLQARKHQAKRAGLKRPKRGAEKISKKDKKRAKKEKDKKDQMDEMLLTGTSQRKPRGCEK